MAVSLSPRQMDCLAIVQIALRENNEICPSFDEMKAALGLKSKSNVHYLLSQLEKKGRIRRQKYRHRAVEVIVPLNSCDAPDGSKRIARLIDGLRQAADRLEERR